MRRVLKPFATRDGTRPLNQPPQCPLVLPVFPSTNDTLSRSNASQRYVIISKSSEARRQASAASYLCLRPSYIAAKYFSRRSTCGYFSHSFLTPPSPRHIRARSTIRLLKCGARLNPVEGIKARNFYDNGCNGEQNRLGSRRPFFFKVTLIKI